VLAWAEDHVRLFQALSAVVAISIGGGGFVLGWLLRHAKAKEERKNYLQLENDEQMIFDGHALAQMPDGSIKLEVVSWGPKRSLGDVFNDKLLEGEIRKVIKRGNGLVSIPPPGQFLMMTCIRDAVVGNDWTANPAALKGRPVQEDRIIIAPVVWPGVREDRLFRVAVIDLDWMERLTDPAVIARIVAAESYYQYRAQHLHDIAVAWLEERKKSREVATIWQMTIHSAKLG
jgi:hypothetical protein